MLAVPVAPEETLRIARECGRSGMSRLAPPFCGVGDHYQDFPQVPDEEVVQLLRHAASGRSSAQAARIGVESEADCRDSTSARRPSWGTS